MTPYHADPWLTVYQGDCREVMAAMEPGSVHCVVTSPPYWGLRDYGTGGQLGLEPTPEEYVANMVDVFREVKRVLRDDGTVWLNLGDSYFSASSTGNAFTGGFHKDVAPSTQYKLRDAKNQRDRALMKMGYKAKDLVGIPWRVAFALQADGWVLRSDIVWSKPNPMPESVTDRPTKAHEMVFLLAKSRWIGPERGQFADISDEDARWLALLLDTEGNIVIKRSEREDGRTQYGAQLAFANTHRGLLERAQAIVGKGSIHERAGRNAPMFYWQMAGREARDLLYRIAPFLIVKQRQARVAIHMQDVVAEPGKKRPGRYRTTEHEAFLDRCWQTVKVLNHFGDPDLSWVPELRYGKWEPERYWFDAEAVREPGQDWSSGGPGVGILPTTHYHPGNGGNGGLAEIAARYKTGEQGVGRNIRSVWSIATQPYPGAHFATFPEKLVEPCIKAGCPDRVCSECGRGWERQVERGEPRLVRGEYLGPIEDGAKMDGRAGFYGAGNGRMVRTTEGWSLLKRDSITTGWRPTCTHDAATSPGTVLDPFAGSGTTGRVAQRLSRRAVLIDLNGEYLVQAMERNRELPLGLEAS